MILNTPLEEANKILSNMSITEGIQTTKKKPASKEKKKKSCSLIETFSHFFSILHPKSKAANQKGGGVE